MFSTPLSRCYAQRGRPPLHPQTARAATGTIFAWCRIGHLHTVPWPLPPGPFADRHWSRTYHPPMAPQYGIAVITVAMRLHLPFVIKAIFAVYVKPSSACLYSCHIHVCATQRICCPPLALPHWPTVPLQPPAASPSLRIRVPGFC